MMAFVEDDEAESVAEALHEAEGRGISRDGDCACLKVAAAYQADLRLKA